jgi:hypothetical protein
VASLPYVPVESNELLKTVFSDLAEFSSDWQFRQGTVPRSLKSTDIRLLDKADFKEALTIWEYDDGIAGLYDSVADIAYARITDHATEVGRIGQSYIVAHEIGHKLTRGTKGITTLSEGMADEFARDFMQDIYLPKHEPEAMEATAKNGEVFVLDGIVLPPDQLFYRNPNITKEVIHAVRPIEILVLNALKKKVGADDSKLLMQAAIREEPEALRKLVASKAGSMVWMGLQYGSPTRLLQSLTRIG